MNEFINFFNTHKDSNFLKERFNQIIDNFYQILNKFNLDFLLTASFDDYGEILPPCIVETLKDACMNFIQERKNVINFFFPFINFIIKLF